MFLSRRSRRGAYPVVPPPSQASSSAAGTAYLQSQTQYRQKRKFKTPLHVLTAQTPTTAGNTPHTLPFDGHPQQWQSQHRRRQSARRAVGQWACAALAPSVLPGRPLGGAGLISIRGLLGSSTCPDLAAPGQPAVAQRLQKGRRAPRAGPSLASLWRPVAEPSMCGGRALAHLCLRHVALGGAGQLPRRKSLEPGKRWWNHIQHPQGLLRL